MRAVVEKALRAAPSLKQIVEIREDPNVRFTTSPFGVTPEQYANNPPVYLGKSAPWKGIKGLGIDGFAKALVSGVGLHGAISLDARNRLVTGLRAAISISKKAAGIKGTTLYQGKLYPAKCIEQKRLAGKA